jgi:hypothetical protein
LRREYDHGGVVRIRWGVYMLASEWASLGPDARYLSRIKAHAAMSESPPVFSHQSAAAIWGLPQVGAWPPTVDVLIPPSSGGRSGSGVRRHPQLGLVEIVHRNGLMVTSAAATAVAMGRVLPFAKAVAMIDKAVHIPRGGSPLTTPSALVSALSDLGPVSRRAAASRAIAFASTLSASAGESMSRAHMFLLGFLLPALQTPFTDAHGFIGYTDFFWATENMIGEFDGFGKYLRDEFARGRSTTQIVIDEKVREDRLRACGPSVSRWGWTLALDLARFNVFLERIGIPRAR